MSNGLGRNQALFLAALLDLEREHGSEREWRIGHVAGRVYALSPSLQEAERKFQERRAAANALLEQEAAAGDDNARMLLFLGDAIRSQTKRRATVRGGPLRLEQMLNPTRVVQLLAKRGLIQRTGHGWIVLTPSGRAHAQQAIKDCAETFPQVAGN